MQRQGVPTYKVHFSTIQKASVGLIYTETSSKNRPEGAGTLKISRKEGVIYATPDEGECCPGSILDTYMERVPQYAVTKDECLYLRPLPPAMEI